MVPPRAVVCVDRPPPPPPPPSTPPPPGCCVYLTGDKTPRWRPVSSLLATYPRLGIPPPAPYTPAHSAAFPESRAALYRRAGATARHIATWAAAAPGVATVLAVGHGISCEAAIFGLDPAARMKMITCTLGGVRGGFQVGVKARQIGAKRILLRRARVEAGGG